MNVVDMRRDSRRRVLGIPMGKPKLPYTLCYVAQLRDGGYAQYLRSLSAAGVERLGSNLALFPPDDPRIQRVRVIGPYGWDLPLTKFSCWQSDREPATPRQLWVAYNLLTFVPPPPERI